MKHFVKSFINYMNYKETENKINEWLKVTPEYEPINVSVGEYQTVILFRVNKDGRQ